MANPGQVLERLTLVAPLGLRFHDAATGENVGDGLSVVVYPANNSARRVEAFVNRSGTYVLHHAPGLRAFEHGAGDDEFWSNLPPPQTFVVEVIDRERRFQPFMFEVELPAPRGLFNWLSPIEPSPPAGARSVPLYSAPARALNSGMAVVRADLWNAQTSAPAAWAVLEARLDGQLQARGMSDERGSIVLIFPYPKPTDSPLASPVASPPLNKNVPLLEQAWELTLKAGYAPPEDDAAATKPAPIPNLRAALDQLNAPQAVLWADFAGLEELASVTLKYGQELILKSQDSITVSPPAPQSVLFITPAGSPP
jgi:hypothetical protein